MKNERLIQVLIVVGGLTVFVYLISLNLPKAQAKGVIAGTVVGIMGLVWGTAAYFDRKRRRELAEVLTGLGLSVGAPREARYIHRLEKGQRSLEGKFWAEGTASGGPVEVAEFIYKTGRGKHTQTHRNMQVSRPCPGEWPAFRVSRRLSFMRRPIASLIGGEDFGLENESFGKRWSIECADKDFVVLLLAPIVQDWLMLAPKDESWTIADGRVCVTQMRRCDAAETIALINRLDEFLAMVPGELAAYGPSSGG